MKTALEGGGAMANREITRFLNNLAKEYSEKGKWCIMQLHLKGGTVIKNIHHIKEVTGTAVIVDIYLGDGTYIAGIIDLDEIAAIGA